MMTTIWSDTVGYYERTGRANLYDVTDRAMQGKARPVAHNLGTGRPAVQVVAGESRATAGGRIESRSLENVQSGAPSVESCFNIVRACRLAWHPCVGHARVCTSTTSVRQRHDWIAGARIAVHRRETTYQTISRGTDTVQASKDHGPYALLSIVHQRPRENGSRPEWQKASSRERLAYTSLFR